MRGSIKLFTWYGIPVHLHWSFGLIFVYVFWLGYKDGNSTPEIAWQMGLVAALFGCVLLHEYGHALTARRYGVGTRDIILTPIGGVARLERMPEKPIQEFFVAIAGPLVNILIAAVLSLVCYFFFREDLLALFSGETVQAIVDEESGNIVDQQPLFSSLFAKSLFNLAFLNIGLAVFNLIPAFPMDGGRILRALLSMRIGRAKATKVAAGVGQVLALGLAGWGLWSGDFMLAVLGMLNSAVAAYYYLRIIGVMLANAPEEPAETHRFYPAAALALICFAAILLISIFPTPLLNWTAS